MTILVGGSSGDGGVVDSISLGDTAPAASSGILFTVPAPAGKRVVITSLLTQGSMEDDIEIKFGTRVVYSGSISDSAMPTVLTIAQAPFSSSSEYLSAGMILSLGGDIGETLVITKTSGSTVVIIHFSHVITD